MYNGEVESEDVVGSVEVAPTVSAATNLKATAVSSVAAPVNATLSMNVSTEVVEPHMPPVPTMGSPMAPVPTGETGGLMDKYFFPFCNGRVLESIEKDEKQFEADEEIFWASGACIFVRKKLFDECGGLDGDLFAHMEEIDLCWRLKNRGYKIMYCHSSEVFHVGGGSLHKSNPFKTYLNFRNNLITFTKNRKSSVLFLIVFF